MNDDLQDHLDDLDGLDDDARWILDQAMRLVTRLMRAMNDLAPPMHVEAALRDQGFSDDEIADLRLRAMGNGNQ